MNEKELREIIIDELLPRFRMLDMAREDVDDALDLFESGVLDSLSLIDLLMSVELRLGCTLDFASLDFTRLVTMGVLVDQLYGLQNTAKAHAA